MSTKLGVDILMGPALIPEILQYVAEPITKSTKNIPKCPQIDILPPNKTL